MVYARSVRYTVRQIIFPEGDRQEIDWPLRFHQVVDVGGRPLQQPVPTTRMLAYRVFRISTEETRNEEITSYQLEQLLPNDLIEYTDETK